MNLTPEQQKQRDELLADMEKMRQRIESFCAPEPVKSEWPQTRDDYLFIDHLGEIIDVYWTHSPLDHSLLALGNVYRPEHRAYAERHVKAMQVQAELRRMPGVCSYEEGRYGISLKHGCNDLFATRSNLPHAAIGGVWFHTRTQAQNAIDSIGARRLQLWIDDYIQTPIKAE